MKRPPLCVVCRAARDPDRTALAQIVLTADSAGRAFLAVRVFVCDAHRRADVFPAIVQRETGAPMKEEEVQHG